ncbi:MAG TPA: class I SAM-dependent methyltransferase [Gemmataceae bacterium]|jgi:SAM-dependent methyltransferase|nr:class I SAM-dependent methyltransferase [Gemmataceae bacterium]
MSLATECEIQSAYRGGDTAARYVRDRFMAPLHGLLHDKQVRSVQGLIDRVRPQSVLEIAPGPGRITRDVRPVGALVCLEYNEGMIAEGRAACGDHVQWVRGNAFDLPFAAGEFDFAYSFRFVRHFHLADRRRLYDGIRRVLKPGGHFVMDAVNERVSGPLRRRDPAEYPIYDELYTPDRLRAELADAGFDVVRLEPVQKCFGWQQRSQILLGPRANWLNRLVIRGLERLPFRDGLEWIVTCRRA